MVIANLGGVRGGTGKRKKQNDYWRIQRTLTKSAGKKNVTILLTHSGGIQSESEHKNGQSKANQSTKFANLSEEKSPTYHSTKCQPIRARLGAIFVCHRQNLVLVHAVVAPSTSFQG